MIVTYTGPSAEHLIVNLDFVELAIADRDTTVLHMASGKEVRVVADAHEVMLTLIENAQRHGDVPLDR